jgi:signal transduction histidine kinase
LKPKLTIVLGLIVITPLVIIGYLGAKIVRDEQAVVEHGVRELVLGQLRAVDALLARSLERYEQVVAGEMTPLTDNLEELRRRTRESPFVLQYYVHDAEGWLVFPPVRTPASLSNTEREALERTGSIWDGRALSEASSEQASGEDVRTGWHVWYWGNGLQLMFWKRDGQRLYAAEINRTRLLAELIGSLPETDAIAPELAEGRIRLVDSTGRPLYQWGLFEVEDGAAPVARLALSAPLGAWTLEYHAPAAVFGAAVTGGLLLNLATALVVLVATVVGLTYYFFREQSREMREATQRVSFVNQVSHELKTPLTNIRMYAELLEKDGGEWDERSRRRLGVIVSESQRLSRLIGNVLLFSRKQRRTLELHHRSGVVDDVLRSVLDHFRPALAAKQIEVEFAPNAPRPVLFDPDAVEQIVGNLISNVEKYGASGRYMKLASHQRGDATEIIIADRGPGLPPRERQRIFEPFYRVHSALTEGVSGTGIGLSIGRDLARLHGGDLELVESERGACFRVTLHTPPAATEGLKL